MKKEFPENAVHVVMKDERNDHTIEVERWDDLDKALERADELDAEDPKCTYFVAHCFKDDPIQEW